MTNSIKCIAILYPYREAVPTLETKVKELEKALEIRNKVVEELKNARKSPGQIGISLNKRSYGK